MPFEQGEAIPFVQPDPPVRAFFLASDCGGGPVNLVSLGPTISGFVVFFGVALSASAVRIRVHSSRRADA